MDFSQLVAPASSLDLNKLDALKYDNVASPAKMRAILAMADEIKKREAFSGLDKWFVPGGPYSIDKCPKHKVFFSASALYNQIAFNAGNRTGKSVAGAYATACHATGRYPEWWDGKRFDCPTSIWAAGQTAQTTRDTVQKELMGGVGDFGSGTIARELIIKTTSRSGCPGAFDTVLVKHISGGVSELGFKSYDQELKAYMGTLKHAVWLDEECPELIYNECFIRTVLCGGIIYVTFTPLHGMTEFISNFDANADHLAGAVPILQEIDFDES